MIVSMTGFGQANFENERLMIITEFKTLNSKYLDISLKLPKGFAADKELELRNLIKEHLQRGKINAVMDFQFKEQTESSVSINREILKYHFQVIREVANDLGADQQDLFRLAMQMPDVINQDLMQEETNDEDWPLIRKTFLEALQKCENFRQSEGEAMEKSFRTCIQNMSELLEKVKARDPQRQEMIKERIQNRIQEIQANEMFDQNRFEQEMIYYIEKLDITEEKVRLQNHLEYFAETLDSQQANGKKLNFISQEIGREINTIGAKANDAEIQRYVVQMKEELEKVKEQVLNVL